MTTKSTSGDFDNPKLVSTIHYGTADLSDAARIYRKEESIKKKLKSVLDLNAGLEHDIKVHQSEIKDERAGIAFQLHDLTKEMTLKFGCFSHQNLQKSAFHGNEASHCVLQQMMGKYERIQKECMMMRKIFDSLQRIHEGYIGHAKQMQQLVLSQEISNQQYEEQMGKTLNKVNEEIKAKKRINNDLDTTTQQLIKEIDMFISEKESLKEQEDKIMARVQQLKNMVSKQQKKVDKIKQWAEVVIDKNNRTIVFKTLKQKKEYLDRLKKKNDQLEIYLCELENEEEMLIRQSKTKEKENKHTQRTKAIKKNKFNKEKSTIKSWQPNK